MVKIIQVSEKVWAHTAGETKGNVAWVNLGDFLVMVDSGMDPLTIAQIKKKAEEMTNLKFKYLVLTHSHSDHILGNQAFKDCEIIATESTCEQIKESKERWTKKQIEQFVAQRPEFKEKWKDLEIVLPTKTFEKEYIIKAQNSGKTIHIVETNGHTKGSAFVFVPEDKIIIAGDLIFAETYPYGADPSSNIYEWIRALDKITDYQPRKIVPGHGPVTVLAEVDLQRSYLQELVEFLEKHVNTHSLNEIKSLENLPEFPYKMSGNKTEIDLKMREEGLISRAYETVRAKITEKE